MKSHASMNRIYRLVWNAVLGIWVAVAENAKGRGKSGRAASALLSVLALLSPSTYAADAANASVVSGAGSVATQGLTTTINQTSQRLAIDWTQLSTAANEALRFNQPNAQAIALNRITGSNPSAFLGSLTANGQVFILNPNGVLFGAGSQVNVGGLVASTLAMSNADFQAGRNVFTNSGGTGSVVNQGSMTAASGGYLALLAPEVRNEGVMTASLGTALLAAGNKVTLNLDNGSLLGYSIDQGAINALAENKQLIQADGGQVLLSAKAMDALTTATVNNTGVIEARTIQTKAGRILLMGDMEHGTVNVGGTLDASAPNGGNGGFIETSAARVKVMDNVRVTTLSATGNTGNWLIDPTDFNIIAGSAANDGSSMGATALGNSLNTTSVTIATAAAPGDINVNAAVTWSAATTLTLSAHRNININYSLTSLNTGGKLALKYGMADLGGAYRVNAPINLRAGDNFSTQYYSFGPVETWKVITDLGASGSTTGKDLQGMNGNLRGKFVLGADIDASATSDWGFLPIAYGSSFSGTFDGLGHTISNLRIINFSATSPVGLFSTINGGGSVRNVGLLGGFIWGNLRTGSLVGDLQSAGGAGLGRIDNSYSTAEVRADGVYSEVGGLVGNLEGVLTTSYFAGTVFGKGYSTGGLAGRMNGLNARISDSYSTGRVRSNADQIGGLVGIAERNSPVIERSYSSGAVEVISCVSSCTRRGGLVGVLGSAAAVSDSFWDTTTSIRSSVAGTGKTTAELLTQSTYTNWDFVNTWVMVEGMTRPMLRTEYSTTINTPHQLQLAATAPSASYTMARDINLATTSGASDIWGSTGFSSIGNSTTAFTGSFDGAGRVISNLNINRPGADNVGLFGITGIGANISNLGLVGGSVLGRGNVGGLVGSNGGTLANDWSTVNITGVGNNVGGLAGSNGGTISNSYATGSVTDTAGSVVGGLVGSNIGGIISNSYATGLVTGATDVGGLVGSGAGTVSDSFWDIGTTGSATSAGGTGKTAAQLKQAATFSNWNIASTGGSSAVWRIYEGNTGPLLRSFLTAVTVADAAQVTYDATVRTGIAVPSSGGKSGTAASGSNAGTYSAWSGQTGYDITGGLLVINPFAVNLTGTRVYDGTTDVAASAMTIGALVAGQTLTLSGTGSITGKNAGTANAVTGGFALGDGTGLASNYTFTGGTQQVDVTTKALAYTVAASNKTYDGNMTATAALTLAGLVGIERLGSTADASFNSKDVATANLVTVNSASLSNGSNGGLASNYSIAGGGTAAANITAKALTYTVSAGGKTYDGNTTAAATLALAGLVGTETLGSSNSATFNSKDVTAANLVTVSTATLTDGSNGGIASNYSIAGGGTTAANINVRALTYATTAANKSYDGTTTASAALGNLAGFIGSETVSVSGNSATFNSKDVANANLVTVNNVTLADGSNGGMAGNYSIAGGGTAVANITAKALTYTAAASNKSYDGNTAATAALTLAGLVGIERLSSTADASFNSKDVATANLVTVNSASLSNGSYGGLASNYSIAAGGTAAANITAKALTYTAVASNKSYDGNTAAAVTLSGLTGLLGMETVTAASTGASFNSKDVLTANLVTVNSASLANGSHGGLASNYSIAGGGTAAANITPAALLITANNDNRLASTPYSGGNGVVYSGLVGGETAAVLTGALTYGGNSQGASAAGSYAITPGGQTGSNYAIAFNNGRLTLTPASATASALGAFIDLTLGFNAVDGYNATLNSLMTALKIELGAALNIEVEKVNVQLLNDGASAEQRPVNDLSSRP